MRVIAGFILITLALAMPALAQPMPQDITILGGGMSGGPSVRSVPAAGGDALHIPPGRSAPNPWNTSDGHTGQWDITNNGVVNDGANDAFDGGMQLQVSGTTFPGVAARLSAAGDELECGPWAYGNLNISRRIYVDSKIGYCRWIDIFENNTDSPVTVNIRYYSNMGDNTQRVATSSGGADWGENDFAAVTGAQNDSSSPRPSIAHILCTPAARVRPRMQYTRNNDEIYYHYTLEVPARKAAALCVFMAQRKPFDQAVAFMKDFKPARELGALPPALRQIIVNMTSATVSLGGVDLRRSDQCDLLVLRGGDEIRGQIANDKYVLKSRLGELTIPAGQVVGIVCPNAEKNIAHLVLKGGQIVVGELTSGPIIVRMSGGTELKVPPKGIQQAGCRITAENPEELAMTDPLLVFRPGERLAFDGQGANFAFLTPHGMLTLSGDDLKSIDMDTPAGGLHRAVFRNGSSLAGLIEDKPLPLKLKLGMGLQVSPQPLAQIAFPAPPLDNKSLASLTLRNGDVLFGQFTDAAWPVASEAGKVDVAVADVTTGEFIPEALGQVKFVLSTGTKLGGKMAADYIGFKIEPGPALKVFVGQVAALKGVPPKPATAPATTGPSGGAATRPAGARSAATTPARSASPAGRGLPGGRWG